jgi:hypothetical protein
MQALPILQTVLVDFGAEDNAAAGANSTAAAQISQF